MWLPAKRGQLFCQLSGSFLSSILLIYCSGNANQKHTVCIVAARLQEANVSVVRVIIFFFVSPMIGYMNAQTFGGRVEGNLGTG